MNEHTHTCTHTHIQANAKAESETMGLVGGGGRDGKTAKERVEEKRRIDTSNKELQRIERKAAAVIYPSFPPSLERARFNPSVSSRHPISISLGSPSAHANTDLCAACFLDRAADERPRRYGRYQRRRARYPLNNDE